MPDFAIVDSHVHLCEPARFGYSWTKNAPSLDRQVLPEHLTAAAAPVEIEQFVFVEVDVDFPQHLEEAAWVAEQAGRDRRLTGMVAALPLERGAAIEGELDELCRHKILRAIRRLIQTQPDPEFCLRPDFIAGLKLLAPRDLAFDICIFHHHLPNVIKMVRQCPEVRFVLDHIGKPGIKAGIFDPWRADLKELAALPNVHCKISGVTTEADHKNWTREQLRPYIAHAVETFGFDRIMYGGDWHVSELAGTYPEWVEIVDWVVEGCTPEERRKLFRDNAISFYRLPTDLTMRAEELKRRGFSIAEMRLLARRALPRVVFDFADGAAEDERTLRRNEAAFEDFALLPRPLNGAATRDLSVELFGHKLSMPVIVGPTGLSGLFWPGGELCTARAATAAGTAFCLSHGSVCTLEQLAETGAAPRWMQVFVYTDRGFTRELAERAKAAGYDALVLTIDNQLLGNRERDLRNGFSIPPRFGPAAMAEMSTKAEWLWRMRSELQRVTFGNYVRPGETAELTTLAKRMAALLDPSMSWSDVEALRRIWTGPLILKGVLHPDEARAAADRGVDGIIVSNHGGRQLDGAPAAIEILPSIVEAVGGRIPILIDGGIRRGADAVKALALGAQACLIGRPQLWGLAVAGEAGVAHVLEIYRREIDRVMGLCGVSRIADITPDLLFMRHQSTSRNRPGSTSR